MLGEHTRVSDASLATSIQTLRDNAAGLWGPALGEYSFDWNDDGNFDAVDVTALADTLASLPADLDLDGDGFVSSRDVALLAERQAEAKFAGGPPPTVDLNRDGVSDARDLTLLGEVALYTSHTRFGWLDRNADGKVDDGDYCLVSSSPRQANYFDFVMPKEAADAAFAAATPTLALKITPKNLCLTPVAEVPAGYAPVDPTLATGRQLYVISTNPSPHPVASIAFPIDPSLAKGDEQVSVRVSGDALPANASLVLPTSIAPLSVAASPKTMTFVPSALAAGTTTRGAARYERAEALTTLRYLDC